MEQLLAYTKPSTHTIRLPLLAITAAPTQTSHHDDLPVPQQPTPSFAVYVLTTQSQRSSVQDATTWHTARRHIRTLTNPSTAHCANHLQTSRKRTVPPQIIGESSTSRTTKPPTLHVAQIQRRREMHDRERKPTHICMAPAKDDIDMKYGEWMRDVLIPYGLDTTSLPVHLAYMRFVARYGHVGKLCSIQSGGIGDGHDPQ